MREYKTKMSGGRRAFNYHSKLVARDEYYKSLEHEPVRDKSVFDAGMDWFNNGYDLEDASDDMRANSTFVDGYKKGQRLDAAKKELYDLGRKWFENGNSLEDAPKNYINNEHFCNGYENANHNGRKL